MPTAPFLFVGRRARPVVRDGRFIASGSRGPADAVGRSRLPHGRVSGTAPRLRCDPIALHARPCPKNRQNRTASRVWSGLARMILLA